MLLEKLNIRLHDIRLNYEQGSAVMDGQIIVETGDDGTLKQPTPCAKTHDEMADEKTPRDDCEQS